MVSYNISGVCFFLFFVCCEFVFWVVVLGGNWSQGVECGVVYYKGYGYSCDLLLCLFVDFLFGGDGYGKLQLDVMFVLLVYFGWILGESSYGEEIVLCIQGECVGEFDGLCWFSVSLVGMNVVRVLIGIDLDCSFYSEMLVL